MAASDTAGDSDSVGAVSVDELCQRYRVDLAHARHVADLALAIFDGLTDVHGLPPAHRALLETAALLHNVGLEIDPPNHHLVGRDLVLRVALRPHSRVERDMIACCVRFHRKRVRPTEEPVFQALPKDLHQPTLALAAILRVADGLDYSGNQGTRITAVEPHAAGVRLLVEGPDAPTNAARAEKKADLWQQAFGRPLRVRTTGDPAAPAGWHPVPAPAATAVDGTHPTSRGDRPTCHYPAILPDQPLTLAAGRILGTYSAALRRHEQAVVETSDADAIHDERVATRRLRAALRLFGPLLSRRRRRQVRRGLRALATALGAVRDVDVATARAQAYLDSLSTATRPDIAPLLAHWRKQRRKARVRLERRLATRRHRAFARALARSVEQLIGPDGDEAALLVRHVLPNWLRDGYRAVLSHAASVDAGDLDGLHRLRIDCKRLRYTIEFFHDIAGETGEDVVATLIAAQDELGNLHDAVVAANLLRDLIAEHDAAGAAPVWEGVRAYLTYRERERDSLLAAVPALWARLDSPALTQSIEQIAAPLERPLQPRGPLRDLSPPDQS